jgi:hypothetical protein
MATKCPHIPQTKEWHTENTARAKVASAQLHQRGGAETCTALEDMAEENRIEI